QRNHGHATAIADAVLHDAGDEPRIDGEVFAGDGLSRHLRLNLVRDPIELPADRITDHRDRFRQPHVPHAPIVDLLLELLARQTGADLLLERQAADARVLHAIDPDRLDVFAD